MDINCKKLSEYICDRLLMDHEPICFVQKELKYEGIYETLQVFANDYLKYVSTTDLKQAEDWVDVKKQVLGSVYFIIEGQSRCVGLDTLLMVFGTIKIYMNVYKTHRNSGSYIRYLRNELLILLCMLSNLWACPTNSHRVLLDQEHMDAIIM